MKCSIWMTLLLFFFMLYAPHYAEAKVIYITEKTTPKQRTKQQSTILRKTKSTKKAKLRQHKAQFLSKKRPEQINFATIGSLIIGITAIVLLAAGLFLLIYGLFINLLVWWVVGLILSILGLGTLFAFLIKPKRQPWER